jgi:hypothetical protein
MPVLVGTRDGYHEFTGAGGHDHVLAGHSVGELAPGPAGTWVAIVDERGVWQLGTDGAWVELATADTQLLTLTTARDVVFAGTADARVLRLDDDSLTALASFDAAPGRDEWHQVGPPIHVRSLTSTSDGATVLANVHVGGILRSTDGGESWHPTLPVDDDVHEVAAHPTRPEVVVAAAAVGLCRSNDAGASWDVVDDGLDGSTYSRGIAVLDDVVFVANADGPFASTSRVYSARLDDARLHPVGAGLPASVPGMIDTRGLAAGDGTVALASGAGQVWVRARGRDEWDQLADDLADVLCVAVI